MDYSSRICNTIQAAKAKGYQITAISSETSNVYTWQIRIVGHRWDRAVTFSTYPGFCGGAMMYYIPSMSDGCEEAVVLLAEACKEFIGKEFRRQGRHVVVAYASDDDLRGQEAFLQHVGFTVAEEFVSVKTSNLVRRYECILPSEEDIQRAINNREERIRSYSGYSE